MVKKVVCTFIMAVMMVCACSAGGKADKADGTASKNQGLDQPDNGANADVSYAFGMYFGSVITYEAPEVPINYSELVKGLRDILEGKEPRIPQDDASNLISTAIEEAKTKTATENKQKETEFLSQNAGKPGVQTTDSGLQYEVIVQGTGAKPGPTDTVEVQYEGILQDGTKFDSTYDRNEPAQIPLNMVIPGWSEGMQLMNIGSTYKLYIPSELAYGQEGRGAVIPPNATLIFKVELKSIVKPDI